jgi:hypothetical protein
MCRTRPIRTRFRYGCGCYCLNLATESNSLAHSPKGTPSHVASSSEPEGPDPNAIVLRQLVSIRFQVLFHSPYRGSFHPSLTVLVHYRSPRVFSLGGWTPLLPTGLACPVVLKVTGGRSMVRFCLRDYHPLWSLFPEGFG